MKRICTILFIMFFGFMLQACSVTTYPTTQDDIYTEVSIDEVDITGVDMNIIIRRGRPYYYSGTLLYYLYRDIYYYPYYYDNYWYFRAYRRPFPYTHSRPYFRPNRHDYRFHQGYVGHRSWYRNEPRGHSYNRIQPHGSKPDVQLRGNRPDVEHRLTQPNVRSNNGRPQTQTRSNQSMNRGSSTISRPSTPIRSGSVSRPSNMGGSRGGFNGSSRSGSMRGGRGR